MIPEEEIEMSYLRSYEPLTKIQAELIVAAAGSPITSEMEAQITSLAQLGPLVHGKENGPGPMVVN